MSNYTKLTDFASKDALPTGSPAKIVKGTEIDDELQAIENAIATKADQTYVDAIDLSVVWPVGSVYINASSTTNPATLLGFGTWVEIGAGRVLVGQDTGDASFDVMGETGGLKDATLVSHSHTASVSTTSLTGSVALLNRGGTSFANTITKSPSGIFSTSGGPNYGEGWQGEGGSASQYLNVNASHSHSATINAAGGSATNANLQPYIVVKMWQRTA